MEGGKFTGSTKSSSRKAPMEGQTGNTGKAIGDKGKSCPRGNSKTRGAADRYK